jgi:excisionase family DNA binding protein
MTGKLRMLFSEMIMITTKILKKMDLKIKDIADLLKVEEKTINLWIKDKKTPCYKINHQYRFNKTEIKEWILSHKNGILI